jgi:hypothetical protein
LPLKHQPIQEASHSPGKKLKINLMKKSLSNDTLQAASEPLSPVPIRPSCSQVELEGHEVATPSGDAAVAGYVSRGSRRGRLEADASNEHDAATVKVSGKIKRPAAPAETQDQAEQRRSNFSQLLNQAFSSSGREPLATQQQAASSNEKDASGLKEGKRQAGVSAAAAATGTKKEKAGAGGFDAAAAQAELGSRWQEVEAALLAGEVEVIGRHSAG